MRLRRAVWPLVLSAIAVLGRAQSSTPSVVRSFAIKDVKIEIGDGRTIDKGTIVIQDGMIVAVGTNVIIPKAAEILDGTGQIAYPGFIDCYTTKGLKIPELKPLADSPPDTSAYASAFMREANRGKVRPDVSAASCLSLDQPFLKSYRNAGFTSAVVAPEPSIIGGVATFVDLGNRPARNSVLLPQLGMTMGFGRNPGSADSSGYPGTVLGSIALLRQTLLDSQWQTAVKAAYDSGGTQRPAFDPALSALVPVLAKTSPVLFEASGRYDILRALDITQEFGLKSIIVGGGEAWRDLDRLQSRSASVLVSIAFGEEPKDPTPPVTGSPAPKVEDDTDEVPEPPQKFAENKRLYDESVRNTVQLAQSQVPFGFTTHGAKDIPDFFANLRRVVKAGLPRDRALQALTIQAAKIFGIDQRLGSIEAGKLANIVVMSGDFLDEKTKVKMVYVDGEKIDPSREDFGPSPRPLFGVDRS